MKSDRLSLVSKFTKNINLTFGLKPRRWGKQRTALTAILHFFLFIFCLGGTPGEHFVHGVATPCPSDGVGGWGYQRSLPSPLDLSQWVYHIKSNRKVRWYHPSSQTLGTVLYTAWEHTCFMHHTHTHTVIYYSNKSLAPPNFLWISISPWTYRHWSTSGIRMCQASLTVTLKNDSQESQPTCACVFACGLGYDSEICA